MSEISNLFPFSIAPFQQETWGRIARGESGLVTAPTGSGKTVAVGVPILHRFRDWRPKDGVRLLWITPLRALARNTVDSLNEIAERIGAHARVELRTGDVSAAKRKKQLTRMPFGVVITPESLHVLISQPAAAAALSSVSAVVIDEWHELIGSKRGTMVELALAYLRRIQPEILTWALSATVSNPRLALDVLVPDGSGKIVEGVSARHIEVRRVLPERVDRFSWTGHLGTRFARTVSEIVSRHKTTLVFTNTRAQAEIWYQALLAADPDLAGAMATHHGSLDEKTRRWVEQAIHDERLKAVVCTSSLDLGVDFAPVDAVVQIGSPKSVARFLQRAGRSGHSPGRPSIIYFVPTNSLELLDLIVLEESVEKRVVEPRFPRRKPLDVLSQWLVTRACGDGFRLGEIQRELASSYAYKDLSDKEFEWCLEFVTRGGECLQVYDEYRKVVEENGLYQVLERSKQSRHRASIGTITSDPVLSVKYLRGKTIGYVEETFAARLKPRETFWLGGACLEFVQLRETTVFVRKSRSKEGATPRWMGGRLSFSSLYADRMRHAIEKAADDEKNLLFPLMTLQRRWSIVPRADELLVEQVTVKRSHHIFVFPFLGRAIHEGLAILFAHRLGRIAPMTVSMAMNDYGFELVCSVAPDVEAAFTSLVSSQGVTAELRDSLNSTELARRHFREIARISGLTFSGTPNRKKTEKYLTASSNLIFDTLTKYEPDSLLLEQTWREAFEEELTVAAINEALRSLQLRKACFRHPKRFTPFAFGLVVDHLRDRASSEKVEDRIRRMVEELEQAADSGDDRECAARPRHRKKRERQTNVRTRARQL